MAQQPCCEGMPEHVRMHTALDSCLLRTAGYQLPQIPVVQGFPGLQLRVSGEACCPPSTTDGTKHWPSASSLKSRQVSNPIKFVSPDGDDSNPGTKEAPWRTLTYACHHLQPGDYLAIEPGTYTDDLVDIGVSGTQDAPIIISAAPDADPETVILDSPGSYYGIVFRKYSPGQYLPVSWIILRDIVVRNADRGIAVSSGSSHIVIENCVVHDCTRFGVYIRGSSDVLLRKLRVYNNGSGIQVGLKDITDSIRRIRVEDCLSYSNSGGSGDGITIEYAGGLVGDVVVTRCKALNNASDGIDVKGAGSLVERCWSEGNNYGFKIWYPNILVRNCISVGNRDTGINCADTSAPSAIVNCTFAFNNRPCTIRPHTHPIGELLVRNCIIAYGPVRQYSERSGPGIYDDDYNLYYMPSVSDYMWYDHSTGNGYTYADFLNHRVPGIGSHSICGDPLFKDPFDGDYSLLPNSPAVGAGTPLSFVEDDYYGNQRSDQPSIGAIEANPVPPPGPYLVWASSTVDDDDQGDSNGNGDGKPAPGETIEFQLSVKNIGDTEAQNLTAELKVQNDDVRVVRATVSLPDIPSGDTASIDEPFVVTFPLSIPDQKRVYWSVLLRSETGDRWTITGVWTLELPDMTGHIDLGETTVFKDGAREGIYIDPGDTLEMEVALQNVSSEVAGNVTGTMRTWDDKVQITTSQVAYGNILPGASSTGNGRFVVSLAPDIAYGDQVPFAIKIEASNGGPWDYRLGYYVFEVGTPDLQVASTVVDDDNAGDSYGNGDGCCDAGETVEFTVSLENVGTATATDVQVRLGVDNQDVQVLRDEGSAPDIAPNSSQTITQPFLVSFPADLPENTQVNWTATVTAAQGLEWQFQGSWTVGTGASVAQTEVPAGLKMISFPLLSDNQTMGKVLGDDIDLGRTILCSWDPVEGRYKVLRDAGAVIDCAHQGYWMQSPGGTIDIQGREPADPAPVPVHPGWNLIPVPFTTRR